MSLLSWANKIENLIFFFKTIILVEIEDIKKIMFSKKIFFYLFRNALK